MSSSSSDSSGNSNGAVKRRGGRAATTSSRLVQPSTPIYALASGFQEYMHMPDPMALYAIMGTIAGNMLTGIPVWLMLVGQSGSGKTLLLKTLKKVERVRPVGSIKGEAALLSGVSKKDRAQDATGGILKELEDCGCLVFMDFTSLLSKRQDTVEELVGALREIFDNTWKREIGGEGGRSLEQNSKVALLAGVTPTIDRQSEVNAEMGQRSIYFRLPKTTGYQEAMSAVNNILPDGSMDAMQDMVRALFAGVGLSFVKQTPRRRLDIVESDRIVSLGMLATKMRDMIPRDRYTRDVIDVASSEVATRISQQFAQLYLGMEVIGVEEDDRWAVIEKSVFDSMSQLRRAVLETVMDATGAVNGGLKVTAAAAARVVQVSETTVRRTLEDMQILGILERVGGKRAGEDERLVGWRLSPWAEERVRKADVEDVRERERKAITTGEGEN